MTAGGDQLPTVRQLAVDLSINPNTVIRAYRELEIRGVLETQQGIGTFISHQKVERDDAERQRRLNQLASEFMARAGSAGFTVDELLEHALAAIRCWTSARHGPPYVFGLSSVKRSAGPVRCR